VDHNTLVAERDHNPTALIGDHEGELSLDGSPLVTGADKALIASNCCSTWKFSASNP
jgi:hypothetical protein